MVRAVVFDLWNTLAVWPDEDSRAFRSRWAAHIGAKPERVDELWYADGAYERRESGSISTALTEVHAALGASADLAEILEWRLDMARRALVPSPEATATLDELRRRGLRTGLISNCTEDVALVWDATVFAALFDVVVFSATFGCMKPDRRIYEHAATKLGCETAECLFVGDGANDELEGARRAGMVPVLYEPGGPSLPDWNGLRIVSIPRVLELIA